MAPGITCVADLDCRQIEYEKLFDALLTNGFGVADGFRTVFCEEPAGQICVLSVMRTDEALSPATLQILRAREVVARERLKNLVSQSETS